MAELVVSAREEVDVDVSVSTDNCWGNSYANNLSKQAIPNCVVLLITMRIDMMRELKAISE